MKLKDGFVNVHSLILLKGRHTVTRVPLPPLTKTMARVDCAVVIVAFCMKSIYRKIFKYLWNASYCPYLFCICFY